jgi:hypothetical protein
MMGERPKSPVLLALYRGIIAFDQWVEVENETERGVAAKCQDGSDWFYVALSNPTYGDCFGVDVSQHASFESLRTATMEAVGWGEDDQLPWCDLDDDDKVLTETDTLERLVAWLQSVLGSDGWTDWEISLMERWAVDEATIYAPGMQIYSALSDTERKELSFSYGDARGGPGSRIPCVTSKASLGKLNEAMCARSLPFLFVSESSYMPE